MYSWATMGRARDSYVATYRATALACCLLLTAAAGGPTQVRFEEDHEAVSPQVSKTPSWSRSWSNFSLSLLYSHRNAWANVHFLGQPNTLLACALL